MGFSMPCMQFPGLYRFTDWRLTNQISNRPVEKQ